MQIDTAEAVRQLEREPLRNIVLLKHIEAFPEHVSVAQLSAAREMATLVLLDTRASAYDRATYPEASFAALIASDAPALTRRLLDAVPSQGHIVFKLGSDTDRNVVTERFAIRRATSFLSFTGGPATDDARDSAVSVSAAASDAAFTLFESQGHSRDWLKPLLASGRAFACILEDEAELRSACIAFENYRRIWEVGGVVTPAAHRGRKFASRVVRAALAELQRRGLVARYQVNEDNEPSIRLAASVGLRRFLQLTHFRTW